MRIFLPIIAVALLSGCAYAIDKQYQDITVLTPGAENASCLVIVDGLKYKLYPPQTKSIFKSGEDLVVDCKAPGNRRNKVVIEASHEESAGLNVLNAGIGLPWDYTSGALFKYPDIVEVSFIDSPFVPQALPAQNDKNIKQPEEYPLEEFSPGQPRLNEDQGAPPIEIVKIRGLKKRGVSASKGAFADGAASDKGNLQNVVKSYGTAIDPANDGPTTIVPGQ